MSSATSASLAVRDQDWSFLPADADAILVVPPFFSPIVAALGPELLAACARQAGLRVATAYVNLSLASAAGLDRYEDFLRSGPEFGGERLFATAAFGASPGRRGLEALPAQSAVSRWQGLYLARVHVSRLRELEPLVEPWLAQAAEGITGRHPRLVGFSVMEGSLAVSYALASRIKRLAPGIVVALGGAACADPMASGVLSLGPAIDVVFAGAAERAFVGFLEGRRRGAPFQRGVVSGDPDVDLDDLPSPDFQPHADQAARLLPELGTDRLSVPAETCRGCWWAVRRRCAFCGFDSRRSVTMKRPDTVVRELQRLASRHPGRRILFTEPGIPPRTLGTVVRRLASARFASPIAWTIRPEVTIQEAAALKAAGGCAVTIGIEALSTSLLERLEKGTTARQSIAALRHCRSAGLIPMWNILARIPGDRVEDYQETVRLMPLLAHLQPPAAVLRTEVVRFSRYFERPSTYGISNLRPLGAYREVFPEHADIERLAYVFDADVPTEAEGPVVEALLANVERWQERWSGPASTWPLLSIRALAVAPGQPARGPFVLTDTRGLPGCERQDLLTRAEAAAALVEDLDPPARLAEWALARKLAVMVDGRFTPLATADPALIVELGASAS